MSFQRLVRLPTDLWARRATMLIVAPFFLAAIPPLCPAADYLELPAGVIHVALPPGDMKIEYTVKNKKPLLRISVGQTVVQARTVFFGDGKHATEYEAREDGIHCYLSKKDRKGFVITGEIEASVGSSEILEDGLYYRVDELKPGSIYLTTPSISFRFKRAAKPHPSQP